MADENYVCPACGTNVANLMKFKELEELSLRLPLALPMPKRIRLHRGTFTTIVKIGEDSTEPAGEKDQKPTGRKRPSVSTMKALGNWTPTDEPEPRKSPKDVRK